jgi:hypothetical protein
VPFHALDRTGRGRHAGRNALQILILSHTACMASRASYPGQEQLLAASEKNPVSGWIVGCGSTRTLVASAVLDSKLDLGKERSALNAILPAGKPLP